MGFNFKEALAAKVSGGGGSGSPFSKLNKQNATPTFDERTVPRTPSPKVTSTKKAVNDDFNNDTKGRTKSCKKILCVTTVIILGIAGFLTWKFGLDQPKSWEEAKEGFSGLDEKWDTLNFTNVLGSLDDIDFGDLFGNDPAKGDATVRKWPADYIDGGLHLTLLNALDDTWQSEFDDALADWQESNALDLTIERVDVDYECNRIPGVMVICNANFGATGWVGINQNEIRDGVIMSSVAKMNEYYLKNAEYDHRRFTMCHEVGHGFGLPHTDEDPYNEPLGNCLDYTDKPSMNVLPGDVNMDKLSDMYLSRRSRRVEKDGTVVETTELVKR